jgi:NifU-like protein involved in Fe-S cluster formation
MEFFLKIENGTIKDASFQAIGCAGAFSSGSALSDMVRGKTVEEAEKIEEGDIIKFLGKIPMQKIHCASLAKRTLRKAIAAYEGKPFIV